MSEKQPERPELERYSDIPLFNTKAVVQQTGMAATTLRAWERRYTIISPNRAQNAYRLYSERDIAIIRWLKSRLDEGMSISQAIALFRHLEEKHNQIQSKGLPSESTSPSQVPLSNLLRGEHQQPIQSDKQGADEQMIEGSSQAARQNVQKRASEMIADISPHTYHMHFVQKQLLDAFNMLDEATGNRLMASLLAIYSVEQICTELIRPTMWEIGRRWEQGLITVSIEHFASAFFHGLLTNLYHAMPTNSTNPLVIACCAPGEVHELAMLMLSLLLRRAGLHVAYLGQSIETEGLLQTIKQLSPRIICVSVTLVSCVEAVTALGQQVQELPAPQPVLIFGGQMFEHHPDLIARIPGVYLDGDLQTNVTQIKEIAFEYIDDNK